MRVITCHENSLADVRAKKPSQVLAVQLLGISMWCSFLSVLFICLSTMKQDGH